MASTATPSVSPELRSLLRRLKLGRSLDTLPERLLLARQNSLGHADFMELVLADEPAASLDPNLGGEIVELLLEDARRRGATLLCSLHQPDLARRFDRLIHIGDGRVVSQEPRASNVL